MHLPYVTLPPIDLSALGLGKLDWFAIFVFTAIVVGVVVYDRMVARGGDVEGPTARLMPEIYVVGGFIGAHLVEVLLYQPELMRDDPWILFKVWAGISSVGGFVGGAIAGIAVLRWRKQPLLPYGDRALVAFAVAWMFGRLGCATSHDHPGRHTDFFLGVRFPDGVRHDLGLYELVFTLFVLVPLLLAITRRPWRTGVPTGVTLALYGAVRFPMDFLRATDRELSDTRYLGLTPAQYGSVGMTLLGLYVLWLVVRRPPALQPPLWGPPAARAASTSASPG